MVALLTPIAKAFFTDTGLESCIHGQQVFGGHGYVREWGQEQLVRDARIAQIYEGTNGIQALDLLGRKLVANRGAGLRQFAAEVRAFVDSPDGVGQPFGDELLDALNRLEAVSDWLLEQAADDPAAVGAAAVDYLHLFGYVAYAYMWARMASVAERRRADDEAFYGAKLATAQFYFSRLLPRIHSLEAAIRAGSASLYGLGAEQFCNQTRARTGAAAFPLSVLRGWLRLFIPAGRPRPPAHRRNTMREVVIVAATRTAIGAFQGSLAGVPAADLGACVIRQLIAQTGLDPAQVDEVILGQVLSAGCGQNPARQAAMRAGLPHTVPAMTLNKVCGSGLKAVQLGAQAIACGDAEIVIAGGQENVSQAPYLLPAARTGLRLGHGQALDSLLHDGLWDAFHDYHMGITAENLVEQYGLSREEQDAFAARSQQRAAAAQAAGRFVAQIAPLSIAQKKGEPLVFAVDEQLRPQSRRRGAGQAAPGVQEGRHGHRRQRLDPQRRRRRGAADERREGRRPAPAGDGADRRLGQRRVDPAIMGIGPVFATCRALEKAGWSLEQLDLIEANEAFAAQALAVGRELHWDDAKVNVNGGAIALGHPIGASGCRVLVSLLHEMQRRDAKRGLATLCIGGGQGVALAVERD